MSLHAINLKPVNLSTAARYLALALLWFGSPLNADAASVGCNDAFVQLLDDELVIDVAPNGSDDTVNLQCALDSAVSTGVPIVRLRGATYFISSVMVENFKGTLEGKTKTATTIEVLDSSVDCAAINDSGRESAAIKFAKGEPRLRFMTINADRPCMVNAYLDAIVHFTGGATGTAECANDVVFGAVDRVIIDGSSIDDGPWSAVQATAEGWVLKGCKTTLLGTFKLNRSTIRNVYSGLVTGMRSGAQVDVNFNEFRANGQAVNLFDSNQNTTVTSNKFFGDNLSYDDYRGVFVTNWSDTPPATSRLVVHNNEFNTSSSFTDNWSYAVLFEFDGPSQSGVVSKISSVVTNNTFNLSGEDVYAIRIKDTSNVHVSANRFTGNGRRAIYASGETPTSGWTITANLGFATFVSKNEEHIRLGINTSKYITGPAQNTSVQDDSGNNTTLPQ